MFDCDDMTETAKQFLEKWQRKRNFLYRLQTGKGIETITCYDKIDLKEWFFSRQKEIEKLAKNIKITKVKENSIWNEKEIIKLHQAAAWREFCEAIKE